MRLLTAPIDAITWKDVLDFCDIGLPEGVTIDYKADFPAELERTVAAMANTAGGIVLIGVAEDRTSTKPLMPPVGVPLIRGLPERVISTCLTGIAPPIVPEIAIAQDSSGVHCFVVVRVPQSHQAPHATARNTRVYLRRGSINSPEDLATLDELEWLKGGRRQSEELRRSLFEQAQLRFNQTINATAASGSEPFGIERRGLITLAFCPTYPKAMLAEPPSLRAILESIRVRDYYGTDDRFPMHSSAAIVVQDGLISHGYAGGNSRVHHTELNTLGLFLHKQSLVMEPTANSPGPTIRSSEVFARLDQMFDCASIFYGQMSFVGSLQFHLKLEEMIGFRLLKASDEGFNSVTTSSLDDSLVFETTINCGELLEQKPKVLLNAARRISWMFNWDLSVESLNRHYLRAKGASVV